VSAIELLAFDSADAWTTATITADKGSGAQTFTPAATVHNAIQWTEAFVAWLASVHSDSATWAFTGNGDRSADITITASSTYSWTASSVAQSLLGVAASGTSAAWSLQSVATTWCQPSKPLAFGAYRHGLTWDAIKAGSGAAGGSSLAVGVRRPVLAGLTEARGAWRLAQLSRASRHPRSITVYDGLTSVDLSLGSATRERSRPGIYRLQFEVLG